MRRHPRRIPKFRDEDEEREVWAAHSPLDYLDTGKPAQATFPKLKPSLKTISIRLPQDMPAERKTLANKRDIPYQSLTKVFLARQIARERGIVGTTARQARRKTSKKGGVSA